MKISILTLFPEMFVSPFDYSIIKRAIEKKLIYLAYINIRDFGIGKHKIVDDSPYGGGAGMIMRVDVIAKALRHAKCRQERKNCKELTILLDPQGKRFSQEMAKNFSRADHLILLCGRYEGVDERIRDLVDADVSIGDYILTGGEIPAMVILDATIRLLPGVLGKDESSKSESFTQFSLARSHLGGGKLLEYPQFTRPQAFEDVHVPKVLLSGNHEKIEKWRKSQAIKKTKKKRPDLLGKN